MSAIFAIYSVGNTCNRDFLRSVCSVMHEPLDNFNFASERWDTYSRIFLREWFNPIYKVLALLITDHGPCVK